MCSIQWYLLVDTLLDVEFWRLQQHVFWHFHYARRGLPRNGFVLDMFNRTLRVEDIFARATPAGAHDHCAQKPETIQQVHAANQPVEPTGQQTPAAREQVQAPRPDELSAELIAELHRVGLVLGRDDRWGVGRGAAARVRHAPMM